ncbi:hypothetical protein B0F90DRAFT_1669786 [Multifurca ochricompacta]|uniref:Uncharacterized protein n=1 Tax=Multifurca ochricompacta TaxID=376703 RepID=A0AAD4QLE4_9AGAM|nr:hypothetical protein B0F90DRAFT_1669786 [Multifurca ochricompacta]
MVMDTLSQTRYHLLADRHNSHVPQGAATATATATTTITLPRKIAQGVFFINPSDSDGDHNDKDNNNNDNKFRFDTASLPSARTLVDLEITHAVVSRGFSFSSSSPSSPSSGAHPLSSLSSSSSCGIKALFVSPHDPLSKIVAWIRAVRQLGAHILIVGDVAAAAGYLVVENGLTPHSAWLRIARGLPPDGDLVIARLCLLALTHGEKGTMTPRRSECMSAGAGAGAGTGGRRRSFSQRSCRNLPSSARAESGLKHVLVFNL